MLIFDQWDSIQRCVAWNYEYVVQKGCMYIEVPNQALPRLLLDIVRILLKIAAQQAYLSTIMALLDINDTNKFA